MQYLYLNKDFDEIDDYYEVEKIITRKNNGKNKLYLINGLDILLQIVLGSLFPI